MTPRDVQHSPDDLSLKAATDALVCAVGGPKRAEGYSRPDFRRYSDYVQPNTATFAPIDAIVALERRAVGSAGWPQVTREMARQTGHVLVKLPMFDADPTGDLHACAAIHAREASDVTAKILSDVSRGRLTARSVASLDLVREAREARDASVTLLAMIEAIAAQSDGGEQ